MKSKNKEQGQRKQWKTNERRNGDGESTGERGVEIDGLPHCCDRPKS